MHVWLSIMQSKVDLVNKGIGFSVWQTAEK